MLDADPGITAAIIGFIGAFVLGVWTHRVTKMREINVRQFLDKKKAYMTFVDVIFDLVKAIRNKTDMPQKELIDRMFSFKKELLVWGDQDVIMAMENYEKLAAKKPSVSELLLIVDDLLRAIRRDLGHNDNKLERGKLVSMLIVAEDRDKLIFSPDLEKQE